MVARLRAAILCLLALSAGAQAATAAGVGPGDLAAEGRALYLEGRRADGRPLAAMRAGGIGMAGAEAACVNCHRRSGLGGSEGRSYIPPITPGALFQAMPVGKGASALGNGRPAYSEVALGQALRHGVDPSGRPLDYLMPRYPLTDREVQALTAYVQQLAVESSPAVSGATLHFATVVAPGIATAQSRAMLEVLQACFDEHNAGPEPERGRKKLAPGMIQQAERRWRLHLWTLQGAQETWSTQLAQHAQTQPVFAMVGGIGGAHWAPVHDFCERKAVPCLFPHVDVPEVQASSFYPLYLGKGVLLEAAMIARQLADEGKTRRVVQVLRETDETAAAGADALQRALAGQGGGLLRIGLRNAPDARTFAAVAADDLVVLWLRPQDLQGLEGIAPVGAAAYVSATLAERDAVPLPHAWKAHALMPYPFDLPQQRAARSARLQTWLHSHGIAPGDERIQADAHVACTALRTAMHDAQDHLGGDYLVERVETNMERTTAIGLYPRLALGIGQRFASKAGYLVRFDASVPGELVPVGERMAP